MSEEYSCSICGTCELRSPDWQGSGSTLDNCKACDLYLEQAEQHLLRGMSYLPDFPLPSNNTRVTIAAVMINRKRPLEALNFCLASLDRTSRACSWHADYEPRIALQALTRFRKADLDPGSPPPVELQPYPHFDLLHTMALAAFLVHDGPSTFALSILRRAYHANPFLSRMVRREEQVRVEGSDYAGKQLAQEGMLYVHRFIRIWVNVPGLEDWLKTCKDDVEMRQCDALGCRKIEDSDGRLSVCARCRQAWYCGVECQKKDWKAGGHKSRCKPPTAFPFPQ